MVRPIIFRTVNIFNEKLEEDEESESDNEDEEPKHKKEKKKRYATPVAEFIDKAR